MDIYEGDILHLRCGSEDSVSSASGITATVEWAKDRFITNIHDKKVKVKGGASDGKIKSFSEIHSWVGMHTCLRGWNTKLEVIGNIYENPELLLTE